MTNRELLEACLVNGTEIEPWKEFIRRFGHIVANAVIKLAPKFGHEPSAFVEEVSAEVFLKLCENNCKLLRRVIFKEDEDERFFGYIKKVATHLTIDYFRRLNAKMRGGEWEEKPLDDGSIVVSALGMDWSEKITWTLDVEKALKKATRGIHAKRNQMIFWLRFRDGFSPEEIAALPTMKLSPKGIETMLARILKKVQRTLYQKKQHSTISTNA
ncbi:MAG TPA: sigma-70 family RNA polymerase sigma factor [Candidatus Angelobacter sp.]|jgi:DNA-directed RNA polymerase specialized sigma24 family protein|nr:sigma-70 family RNA polymerase sigma factor [Candidatus Angelobacter sp.]